MAKAQRAAWSWRVPTLTVRQLRTQSGRLLLSCGCSCRWQRYVDLSSAPDDTLDRTIAALHAEGRWRCPRSNRPAAMVYAHEGGMMQRVERYA